jgi:hypothetical protein
MEDYKTLTGALMIFSNQNIKEFNRNLRLLHEGPIDTQITVFFDR